jgi:LmbE family N-acetylglucosaminyl deacetylase
MTGVLAVSPHLDDAVLSAGGFLRERVLAGDTVVVATLFAGTAQPPFSATAESVHRQWGMTSGWMPARRAEDVRALLVLGAQPRHGEFLDGVYRRRADGSWLLRDGLPPWEYDGVEEPALLAELTRHISELLLDLAPERVLTCAATGGHVDHLRTRDAVVAAAAAAGRVVELWEDLPYASGNRRRVPPVAGAAGASGTLGEPRAEPISEEAWVAKLAAVDCYPSQHPMLWPGGRVGEQLERHALARGAGLGRGRRAEVFRRWTPAARAAPPARSAPSAPAQSRRVAEPAEPAAPVAPVEGGSSAWTRS